MVFYEVKGLPLGTKVRTGKGNGKVIENDKWHYGEYFKILYADGNWKGQTHWEHVVGIEIDVLFV